MNVVDVGSDPGSNPPVPQGFEAVHRLWISLGGRKFRSQYVSGPHFGFYNTNYWALVRQAVLNRDSMICFRCRETAGYVHHLSYQFTGEEHLHPETLASVCGACHPMVEYARLANSLISRIERRKMLLGETEKACARLLEYRAELANLKLLYNAELSHRNRKVKSEFELQSYEKNGAMLLLELRAKGVKETAQLAKLLEIEIQECQNFAAQVLAPITRSNPGKIQAKRESVIVGIKYHQGNLSDIKIGDLVQLLREPENHFDSNAIRVVLQTGETLGYLAAECAAVVAADIDSGIGFRVKVTKILKNKICVSLNSLNS